MTAANTSPRSNTTGEDPKVEAVVAAAAVAEQEVDNSGLIDIKQMARTTRERVSRRVTTQSDVEAALLASSRPSALRDVVLPEPGKATTRLVTGTSDSVPTVADSSSGAPRKKQPTWVVVAAAVVVLGGAVVAVAMTRGGQGTESDNSASSLEATSSLERSAVTARGDDQSAADDSRSQGLGTSEGERSSEGDSDSPTDSSAGIVQEDTPANQAPAKVAAAESTVTEREGKKVDRQAPSAASAPKAESKVAAAPADSKPAEKSRADEDKKPVAPDVRSNASMDDLLNAAAGVGDDKPAAVPDDGKPAKPAATPEKDQLTRDDIKSGMRSILPRVTACYERFKVPGAVKVKVVIANTGVVTKATAVDATFRGTETGACVSKAVGQASFPAYSGAPMSFSYPFRLQ